MIVHVFSNVTGLLSANARNVSSLTRYGGQFTFSTFSKCVRSWRNPLLIRFQSYSLIVSRNSFQYKCVLIWNILTRLNLLMLTTMLSRRSQEGIKRYSPLWTREQPWSLIRKKKAFYIYFCTKSNSPDK